MMNKYFLLMVTLDDVNVDIINTSKKGMRRSFRLSELCVLGLMLDLGVSCYKFCIKARRQRDIY